MALIISATERRHLLDACDRLIAARKKVLVCLVAFLRDQDMTTLENTQYAEHLAEVKRAVSKLARYHPDAEALPIAAWNRCGENGILSDAMRQKTPSMTEKQLAEWRRDTIKAIDAHTNRILHELEEFRDSFFVASKPPGRPPRNDKLREFIRKELKKHDGWGPKDLLAPVRRRFAKRHEEYPITIRVIRGIISDLRKPLSKKKCP
jgi:hypothetical protein